MKTSQAGIDFIHSFEKLVLTAYPDPGSSDGTPWTIGRGTTWYGPKRDRKRVQPGQTCTEAEADEWFAADIEDLEDGVNGMLEVEVTQGMFDALISFAYNVGLDEDADTKAEGLGDSTLLRRLNAGNYEGAYNEFPKWNKNDGVVMRGLTRRRAGEQGMFASEPYPA